MRDEIKITFRIGRPYSATLRELADANCVSVNQYARMALIEAFENQAVLDLKDDLTALQEEVRRFRADFDKALVD